MTYSRSARCVLLVACVWCMLGPCARGQHFRAAEQGIVFVAPAAGDVRLVMSGMERAVAKAGVPYRVSVVEWSSGDMLEDIRNQVNHRRKGWWLAQRVLAYQQACPGRKVVLVGHSAGAAVVLAATRWLPPDSVDRIILLGAGVSSHHDMRQALAVSSQGVDNFYSTNDAFLESIVAEIGNTDGTKVRSAGEVGFVPFTASSADSHLYSKLRQYPWRPSYVNHGYDGGHLGVATRMFLSYAVIPLLAPPEAISGCPSCLE